VRILEPGSTVDALVRDVTLSDEENQLLADRCIVSTIDSTKLRRDSFKVWGLSHETIFRPNRISGKYFDTKDTITFFIRKIAK